MKKLMTIGLAAVMMFAVAGQVKAAVPLETSGELRVRMFYLDDYTGAVAKKGASNEFWDQRLRLTMVWPVADGVKMIARADILEGFWGDNGTTSTVKVVEGENADHTASVTTSGTPAKAAIDFDRVYMEFKWPGSPLTLSIGRQESSWGPGITFKADNRDRFKITGAFDFGTLFAIYQKRKEVFNAHDTGSLDDNRQYGVGYAGKAGDLNFGLVALQTAYEADSSVDAITYTASGYVMGKAGPADISIEAVYTFGENDYSAASGKADQDVSGLGLYAGVFMPAGPVTIGLEGAYAAGDDLGTAKNEGGFRYDYHSPFWSVLLFNNMDLDGYAGESSVGGNTSITNAAAGKLTVVAKPTPALTIVGAGVYAQRLEDTATAKADPLGVEFDLLFIYAITPNVNWTVGAGYLLPGDFYGDADNALAVTSQFVLKF